MQEKALELARESVAIAQVSYENGVITSAELTDAQVALLQTEWLLMQAKYTRIVAAARAGSRQASNSGSRTNTKSQVRLRSAP
jgi:outer membrane protein TolC